MKNENNIIVIVIIVAAIIGIVIRVIEIFTKKKNIETIPEEGKDFVPTRIPVGGFYKD